MTTIVAPTPTTPFSFSYDSGSSSPSISSNVGGDDSIFSDVPLTSSGSQTDPDSDLSSTLADSSEDSDDDFTVYSDDEIMYLEPDDGRGGGLDELQASELFPWPGLETPSSPPSSDSGDSLESYDSDVLEVMDRGYESDTDEISSDNSWRHRPRRAKHVRRSRVHYLVEHIEPVFELVVPFGPGDEIPPIPGLSTLPEDDEDELPESESSTIDRLPGDMDILTESEYDSSEPGPQQVEYVSERLQPIFHILAPITEEERLALAQRTPDFDVSRLLRPATLNDNGEIVELPAEAPIDTLEPASAPSTGL